MSCPICDMDNCEHEYERHRRVNNFAVEIIILDGLPCSGKSTVGREFQRVAYAAGQLWMHVEVDVFDAMAPNDALTVADAFRCANAMNFAVRAIPDNGIGLILEVVTRPQDPSACKVLGDLFGCLEAYSVGVACTVCPKASGLLREKLRPPALRGLVHRDYVGRPRVPCDLEIDTDVLNVGDAGAMLYEFVRSGRSGAFERLRSTLFALAGKEYDDLEG